MLSVSSLQKVKITPPLQKGVLSITLNYTDSEAPGLESVEYPFTAITPRSTLTQNGRVLSLGQIDLFEKLLVLRNIWCHIYYKLFILRIFTWSYNCLFKIIFISYLKSYNC